MRKGAPLQPLDWDVVETPLGRYLLGATDQGLRLCEKSDGPPESVQELLRKRGFDPQRKPVAVEKWAGELKAYFNGRLQQFSGPLDLQGSPFQLECWEALCDIPYGETISYGEEAKRVGRPKGAQAVGQANSRNPISIIVPCHRVIAADGALGGYAGGADLKRTLLAIEKEGLPEG